MPLPIKVFEVSDVVELDPSSETGAVNKRRVSALIYARSPCFEVERQRGFHKCSHVSLLDVSLQEIQGLFDYLMKQLGVPRVARTADAESKKAGYLP